MARQPVYFIFHGGGPCFFMDWDPPYVWDGLKRWLEGIIPSLPQVPSAIAVVTAHWEEQDFQFSAQPSPSLVYDYYGFPKHTYHINYEAPPALDMSDRAVQLMHDAGVQAQSNATRGWDHGVFIPLKVMRPQADIPVFSMSLRADMDASAHLHAGQVLQSLRDENVLIVASGASYHNLGAWFAGKQSAPRDGAVFDAWLTDAVTHVDSAMRNALLANWASAPSARAAHPREEHLLPLMVAAGAAGEDVGVRSYHENILGVPFSGYIFG